MACVTARSDGALSELLTDVRSKEIASLAFVGRGGWHYARANCVGRNIIGQIV